MSEKTYRFSYERTASASYLVIEADCSERVVDYQVEMIANNPNTSVLPLYVRRNDNTLKFYYDVTSKVSLQWLLKRKKLKKNEFIGMLCGIAKPLLEACGYFLKESSFIINENYIFVSPDFTKISLVYLPVSRDLDYLKSYKELVLRLITELAEIEESPADNYLQRILGSVKLESFNIFDFDRLLKEISFTVSDEDNISHAEEKLKEVKSEFLFVPPQKALKQSHENEKMYKLEINEGNYKPIIAIVLLQIVLAFIIFAFFKSQILNNIKGTDPTSAYTGLLLVLGAIDFLVVRGVLSKKEKADIVNADKKNVEGVVNTDSMQKKIDGGSKLSENSSKLTSTKNTPSEEPVQKNEKSEFVSERKASSLGSNCQTEFLSIEKDSSPYLRVGRDGLGENIPIKKNQFIIGRLKEQVDYTSNNNAIGKIHAEIITREGSYYIRDLNSRNGTFVNNLRIENNTEYEIKNNDKISLANSDYVFVIP